MTERKLAPNVGVGMPAALRLDTFGMYIDAAFGSVPYLVGSAATGKQWRDVDVRLILDDHAFNAMFPAYARHHQSDALWSLICDAVSELAKQITGLPVDFQIQSMSEANEKFGGQVRVALLRLHSGQRD